MTPRRDYRQSEWGPRIEDDLRQLLRLAVREDLDRAYDWTTAILVPDGASGAATIVARQPGVIAGLPAIPIVLDEYDRRLEWSPLVSDGQLVAKGKRIGRVAGPARSLLAAERPLLNLLGRLSGVASLTRKYVDAVAGLKARIYDTRKTTPGYRDLEKYAVRMGGGWNHRAGLYDGILIKDNHLAFGAQAGAAGFSPAEAVRRAKTFLAKLPSGDPARDLLIEVEVDSLAQLQAVLPEAPDIVLLDNMSPEVMRRAVESRDSLRPEVELEASGGIRWETIRQAAETGVDRVSLGLLTHSAPWFDVALDWDSPEGAG